MRFARSWQKNRAFRTISAQEDIDGFVLMDVFAQSSPSIIERIRLASELQPNPVMRVALPSWNGRISPVFDVTRRIVVVDIENGIIAGRSEHELEDGARIEQISRLGVDVLICSAISWPVEAMLWAAGIDVVSDICGPVNEIIDAHLSGERDLASHRSPGYSDHDHGGRALIAGTRNVKGIRTPQ
jgi:predicted Fe-Mo cluster-binding NifX family protein